MTEYCDPRALKSSATASIPSTARLQDTVRQDRLSPYPPSSNERTSTDNAPVQQADGVRLPKRLRANTHATTQVSGLSRSYSRVTLGVRCHVSLRFQANGLGTLACTSLNCLLTGTSPSRPFGCRPICIDGITKSLVGRQSTPANAARQQQQRHRDGALANTKHC